MWAHIFIYPSDALSFWHQCWRFSRFWSSSMRIIYSLFSTYSRRWMTMILIIQLRPIHGLISSDNTDELRNLLLLVIRCLSRPLTLRFRCRNKRFLIEWNAVTRCTSVVEFEPSWRLRSGWMDHTGAATLLCNVVECRYHWHIYWPRWATPGKMDTKNKAVVSCAATIYNWGGGDQFLL